MAELLIVLMMAFNLWMVIYLTWERREDNKAEDGKGKDCEMKGMPDDIVHVWDKAAEKECTLRTAAYIVACERILMARKDRGIYPG